MRKFEVLICKQDADEFIEVEAEGSWVQDGLLKFVVQEADDVRIVACFKDWSHFVDITSQIRKKDG